MITWFTGLSPRRRIFAAVLAALAVAGILAAAGAAIGGRSDGRPESRSGSPPEGIPPPRYPLQDRPGPVLLVPGYGGSTGSLSVLARAIRATGRTATVVALPGQGTGSLIRDADVLNDAVRRELRGGAPSVDVIGYSAGGVTALVWARDDGGDRKARRIVTLGSPFHGTVIAATAQAFAPGACPVACRQLVPGSSLLARLAGGAPVRLPWLSLWTTDDLTVLPPASARLSGAMNVPIQSVCPRQQISHSQLPTSPVVTAIVLQAIGPGRIRHPEPAVCRA